MYYLQAEASFDAAHFLKGYAGKCRNLHGHRWRVIAAIQGTALQSIGSQRGMLTDFGDLKSDLNRMTEEFDHALLLEQDSLKPETLAALQSEEFRIVTLPFPTTAENMARYFYDQLTDRGYSVRDVSVYETPTNCACYNGKEEVGTLVQL